MKVFGNAGSYRNGNISGIVFTGVLKVSGDGNVCFILTNMKRLKGVVSAERSAT